MGAKIALFVKTSKIHIPGKVYHKILNKADFKVYPNLLTKIEVKAYDVIKWQNVRKIFLNTLVLPYITSNETCSLVCLVYISIYYKIFWWRDLSVSTARCDVYPDCFSGKYCFSGFPVVPMLEIGQRRQPIQLFV